MREEEKARRDYERAIREAAAEEEMLRKAMAKAQEQIQIATTEQKAKYELQLQDLAARLKETEEKVCIRHSCNDLQRGCAAPGRGFGPSFSIARRKAHW